MATINGAKALGIDHAVGSLEQGKKADIIMFNHSSPFFLPKNELCNNIVYSASRNELEMTVITSYSIHYTKLYDVIRVCARYGHLNILEEGYGINLRHLATFASIAYKDDECECFKTVIKNDMHDEERMLLRRMHKAMTIIQFKLEGQLIKRNPLFVV